LYAQHYEKIGYMILIASWSYTSVVANLDFRGTLFRQCLLVSAYS